ncbi:MAG TPA: hypothetical protein PKC14_00125 [Candidatus Absconditabacterales bacterium]|nr:hypothetical protein [Candidatus Absconditabacterales bacterium]
MARKNFNKQGNLNNLKNLNAKKSDLSADVMNILDASYSQYLKERNVSTDLVSDKNKFFDDFLLKLNRYSGDSLLKRLLDSGVQVGWADFDRLAISLEDFLGRGESFVLEPSFERDLISQFMALLNAQINDVQKFSPEQKNEFTKLFALHPLTISSFQTTIDKFLSSSDLSYAQKENFYKISLSNSQILSNFIKNGLISIPEKTQIESQPFSFWSEQSQRVFEPLISRQILSSYKNSWNVTKKTLSEMANVFKLPSLEGFFSQFGHSIEELSDFDSSLLDFIADGKVSEKDKNARLFKTYFALIERDYPALGSVLTKWYHSYFDFSKLSLDEQQIIVDEMIDSYYDENFHESMKNFYGIDGAELKIFLKDLFDLKKNYVLMPNGQMVSFKKKNLLGGPLPLGSFDDLFDKPLFPLAFEVESSSDMENLLAGKNDFIFINKNTKIHPSYKIKLTDSKGGFYEGYLSETGKGTYALYSYPANLPFDTKVGRQLVKEFTESDLKRLKPTILNKDFCLTGDDLATFVFSYVMQKSPQGQEVPSVEKYDLVNKVNQEVLNDNFRDFNNDVHTDKTDEQKKMENFKAFEKEWDAIAGYQFSEADKGIRKGTVLIVPFSDSETPGGGQTWSSFQVDKVDKEKNLITFKIRGVDLKLSGGHEGELLTMPLTAKSLQKLKTIRGQIYKFASVPNSGFDHYIKNSDFSLESENIKNGIENFKRYDWRAGSCKDLGGNDISYRGKTLKELNSKNEEFDSSIMYKTTYYSDLVRIEYVPNVYDLEHGKNIPSKKKMSYESFMIWCSDKGLKGFSHTDYKKITLSEQADAQKMNPDLKKPSGLKWYTFGDVMKFAGGAMSIAKSYLKEKDEKRAMAFEDWMMMDVQFYKRLTWIPFVGKAFDDAHGKFQSDWDSKIFKKISGEKDSFVKNGSIDAGAVSGEIASLIEKNSGPGAKTYDICGALLYTIENGGLYQRKLRKFAGKGAWVKALFGEQYQQKFLVEVQQKIAAAKAGRSKDVNNDELIDIIVRAEIGFILATLRTSTGEEKKFERLYSVQFANTLEGSYNNMGSSENVNKEYNGKMALKRFSLAQKDFWDNFGKGRIEKTAGDLKAMGALVNSDEEAVKFYGCVLAGIVSGFFRNEALVNVKTELIGMCRKFGFPIGYYIGDANGPEKVGKILNLIAQKRGIPSPLPDSLRSPEKISYLNYSGSYQKIATSFDARWSGSTREFKNANKIVSFLNFKDLKDPVSMFNLLSDETIALDDKVILTELLDKSLESDIDNFRGDTNNKYFYKNAVFNVSNSVVNNEMFSVRGSVFSDDKKETAVAFWDSVVSNFKGLENVENKRVMEFVMKKFYTWFKGPLFDGSKTKRLVSILATIREKNLSEEKKRRLIENAILKEAELNREFPSQITNALTVFTEFLYHNSAQLDPRMIGAVFGEDYVSDYKVMTDSSIERYFLQQEENLRRKIGSLNSFEFEGGNSYGYGGQFGTIKTGQKQAT